MGSERENLEAHNPTALVHPEACGEGALCGEAIAAGQVSPGGTSPLHLCVLKRPCPSEQLRELGKVPGPGGA